MGARHSVETGQRAEQLAREYLESAGLVLIERNYRCPCGELDLIMQHGPALVFVEVRFRRGQRYGSGAESVDARKRAKLIAAAEHYLQTHPRRASRPARFDVVAIQLQEGRPNFDWIQDAFRVE